MPGYTILFVLYGIMAAALIITGVVLLTDLYKGGKHDRDDRVNLRDLFANGGRCGAGGVEGGSERVQKYDGMRYYLFQALKKSEYDGICTLLRDAHNALGRLEKERDALIEELKNTNACFACRSFNRNGGECNGGSVCMMRDYEWRGVKEADDGNRDNDG